MAILALILMFILSPVCSFRSLLNARTNYVRMNMKTQKALDTNPFWHDGLKFGCTGCGKCCKTKGDVWFNTDEFVDLVAHMNTTAVYILDNYAEEVRSGWVQMKSKRLVPADSSEQCIFLDLDGKQCTVYEARPVQCKTYPYWPALLASSRAWHEEAVEPESHTNSEADEQQEQIAPASSSTPAASARKWSSVAGGCEGINHSDAPVVDATSIHRCQQLYQTYSAAFPSITRVTDSAVASAEDSLSGDGGSNSNSDRSHLLTKVDLIQVASIM